MGEIKKESRQGKKTINIDERYMSSAEKFLYGELAVVMEMPRDKVSGYVKRAFGYSDGIGEDRVKKIMLQTKEMFATLFFIVNVKALYL